MTYWIMITLSALLHIAFGAFLMQLWNDRHIWTQKGEYND